MKANGIKLLILALLLVTFGFAKDMDREFLFKQGVSAYAAEDYDKAIASFTQLKAKGEVSWELYYNLGNAYYRSGELGRAIQYWEKAKVIVPNNADVNYNLSIAEQLLIDKVVLPDMFPLFKWYAQFQKRLPLDIAVMSIGLLLAIMLALLGWTRRFQRKSKKNMKARYISILGVFMSLLLVFTAITVSTAQKRKHDKYAIILNKEVNVLSEPTDDAVVLFILHEGSKVKVNKNIEDSWSNISYFDDKVGWIKSEHIGKIEE